MKLSLLIALSILGSATSAAGAEPKPDKPQVCLSYAIAKTDAKDDDAVAICYDGKKPSLFYRFEVVELPGKEQGRIKVLLGWR